MKILVLAPPMGATGGVQTYTASLVRALGDIAGERNVRMVAVAAEASARADGSVALGQITKLRFLLSAIGMAVRWRPQLIFCAHVGVAPVARIIQRITGAPYWVILHGIEVWGQLPETKVHALRGAQQLVAVSRFTLNAASGLHSLNGENAAILPPTFTAEHGLTPDSKKGGVAGEGRPIVLTVARLASSERYKGHDVMLDAWPAVVREVTDAHWVIVGDGDDRGRLEARAAEMGLTGSVTFKGTLSGDELQSCYDECRVFALPARTELDPRSPRGEGFGIVFLEAMAHGKPVVGPTVGAPAEFIRHGVDGLLVDPVNPEQLARALIELLKQPARAQEMGRSGRERVNTQFSYEMFRERLRGILRLHSFAD
jgi:glycosyltransferase involved in cell wall biosynthesis